MVKINRNYNGTVLKSGFSFLVEKKGDSESCGGQDPRGKRGKASK